jgi:transcriptional regulator with XRE-family HTH domain
MTRFQELFIKNLRFFRKRQGLSQLALSEKIEISPNYLNAVENGKHFPSPELIQNISDCLGIFPYELFLEHPLEDPGAAGRESMIQELAELRRKIIREINEAIEKYGGYSNPPR